MSDLDNSDVVKIISNNTKEYNELSVKFKALMLVHVKTVNDSANKCMEYDALKMLKNQIKRDNTELRKLLKQWQKENKTLQEILDISQSDVERLYSEINALKRRTVKEHEFDVFDLFEGVDG